MSLPFSYEIVRSRRRRTVALTVDKGRVLVRVPALTDGAWIEAWVRSKADWILPRLQRQQQALECYRIRIAQNAPFLMEGEPLRLSWSRGARSQVLMEEGRLRVQLSQRISRPEPVVVRERLRRWMAQQAQVRLEARTRELGQQYGLLPPAWG